MMDPRAVKLKMLQELKEYALGALKNRLGGGDAGQMGAVGDATEVADSQPVPGAEDLEEGDASGTPTSDVTEIALGGDKPDTGMGGMDDEDELLELLSGKA